jgi:hypothetical protein
MAETTEVQVDPAALRRARQPMVVTAKTWPARARAAKFCAYTGPLSLSTAIQADGISREEARRRVTEWEEATGQTFRVVEPERVAVKPKPASTETVVAAVEKAS